MENQKQISIKQIPTDRLKAMVYDLSKEREKVQNLIVKVEEEIENRKNQPKPEHVDEKAIKEAIEQADEPKVEEVKETKEKAKKGAKTKK